MGQFKRAGGFGAVNRDGDDGEDSETFVYVPQNFGEGMTATADADQPFPPWDADTGDQDPLESEGGFLAPLVGYELAQDDEGNVSVIGDTIGSSDPKKNVEYNKWYAVGYDDAWADRSPDETKAPAGPGQIGYLDGYTDGRNDKTNGFPYAGPKKISGPATKPTTPKAPIPGSGGSGSAATETSIGLSTGTKVAIGVGVAGALGGIVYVLAKRRRARARKAA